MILVCGEALFDFFQNDESDMGAINFDARVGGSPFNVAIGMARLGGQSALLTAISCDMLGERLYRVLQREAVCTDYLIRTGRRTTISLVALDDQGSPSYSFYGIGSADCGLQISDLPTIGREVTGIHFGSYSTVVEPVAETFRRLLDQSGGILISFDPNVRLSVESDVDKWRASMDYYSEHASLIKISKEDFDLLYPGLDVNAKVVDWLQKGVSLVVLTDGGNPIFAWTVNGLKLSVKPPSFDLVDTVGAGDTFQAALLTCLMSDNQTIDSIKNLSENYLRHTLNYAATAAALTCTRRGADIPTKDEMESIIPNNL